MSLTRRAFFRAVPAAGVAARVAVNEIQQQGLARLAASPVAGPGAAAHAVAEPYIGGPNGGGKLFGRLLAALFRKQGIPSWKKKQLRRMARESRLLDPDLAALRSISPSAMLRMQWRRNEAYVTTLFLNKFEEEDERREYEKKHQTDWLG